jgi:hypothetical protein
VLITPTLKFLKLSKRYLGKLRNKAKRTIASFKYLRTQASSPGELKHHVHLLVVVNPKYASLAKICLESFLYYNPHSVATVHCDSKTIFAAESSLRALIKRGSVVVLLDQTNNEKTWQEQKLDLILQLRGSEAIFMDADLRWNGELRELKGVTFFVKEFNFQEDQKYKVFLSKILKDNESIDSMKNTSFFTWSGLEINDSLMADLFDLYRRLIKGSEKFLTDINEQNGMKRISEQLALSLASDWWGLPIDFLKEVDNFRDGSFVESSYFGATGSEF